MTPLFDALDEVSKRRIACELLAMYKAKLEEEYDESERSERAAQRNSSHPQTKASKSMASLYR